MSRGGNSSVPSLRNYRHQEDAEYWDMGRMSKFTCRTCRQISDEFRTIAECTLRHIEDAAIENMQQDGSLIPYEVKFNKRIIIVVEKGLSMYNVKPKIGNARRTIKGWPPCIICDPRCIMCGLRTPQNTM